MEFRRVLFRSHCPWPDFNKRNLAMDNDNDNDDDNVKDLYVICYTLISLITHHSFYRKDEEKELLLNAYTGILNLIPKLKKVLPLNNDVDEDYLPKVINVVRSAHTPYDAMTYSVLYRCKWGVIWPDPKQSGMLKKIP